MRVASPPVLALSLTLLTLLSPAVLGAQSKTVRSITGAIYRYHGDTIWVVRDSTLIRVVYQADTTTRAQWVNDTLRYTATYLRDGPGATTIDYRRGGVIDSSAIGRSVPLLMLTGERTQLESAIRMEESNAQRVRMEAAAMSAGLSPPPGLPEAPRFATEPIRYSVSARITIVQHADTVRYVVGCPGARADTSVFVFFTGTDSVRRLSPAPRVFGEGMVSSLLGAMRRALLQARLAQSAPLRAGLPRAPEECPEG